MTLRRRFPLPCSGSTLLQRGIQLCSTGTSTANVSKLYSKYTFVSTHMSRTSLTRHRCPTCLVKSSFNLHNSCTVHLCSPSPFSLLPCSDFESKSFLFFAPLSISHLRFYFDFSSFISLIFSSFIFPFQFQILSQYFIAAFSRRF